MAVFQKIVSSDIFLLDTIYCQLTKWDKGNTKLYLNWFNLTEYSLSIEEVMKPIVVKHGKTIQGIDSEEYFGTIIGPMAATILEQQLYRLVQTQGVGMTGPEMKLVQFAIERSYGAATRQVHHVKVSDQEIAAQQLAHLDPETVRLIASTNAPRIDPEAMN